MDWITMGKAKLSPVLLFAQPPRFDWSQTQNNLGHILWTLGRGYLGSHAAIQKG